MMKFGSYVMPYWPGSKPKPDPMKEFFKKIKWKPV